MATAQMNRSAVSAVSLPSRISTEQQSLVLVKRLLAVSVSCITYLRGLFPEYAYGTRYLEDVCVKILREDKSCPGATQMVKWLLGCYDALQKRYLRMLVLAIYTNAEDPQTVTECYQFKFKYTPNGALMDFCSAKGSNVSACSEVKKASLLLVRKLYVLMQNMGPLPNNVCLTMKLFYYDEVTPMDYQPPGFKEGTCEGMMFEGEPMYLSVGEVVTPFHRLRVRVTTDKERMEDAETDILKDADAKSPAQGGKLAMDDEQLPDFSAMDEPPPPPPPLPPRDRRADVQKMDTSSLHLQDLVLANRDEESIKSGSSIVQLAHPESSAGEYRTRSGRLVSARNLSQGSVKGQAAKPGAGKKRQAGKQTHVLDISDSQEDACVTKRRKFSEAKDTI